MKSLYRSMEHHTWPAGSDKEILSRGRQGEYLLPCMALQPEVLGVICHPQNEPLIPVI